MKTCGKMVTVDNPHGNGKSTIPCLLAPEHEGDCDPSFRGLHLVETPAAATSELKADAEPDPHTIAADAFSNDTFSLDDFVARCVQIWPRKGSFVFVSIPQLTVDEIAPIAKKLVELFAADGAQCIVTNKRFDVLDEKSMAEFGWVRAEPKP